MSADGLHSCCNECLFIGPTWPQIFVALVNPVDFAVPGNGRFLLLFVVGSDGALIAVVSMIRRGSVVVSFAFGAFLLHEKNLKSKAVDLLLILIGLFFLYLGSK